MALTTVPLAVLLILTLLLYYFLVYPLLVSPLSKIPSAHWSAPISPVWILYIRRYCDQNAVTHAAHQRLGPLVRLGPREVSVNCVDGGIRTIYGGGYEKGSWYSVFRNYGSENVFSSSSHGQHSLRKRRLSSVYAKSNLVSSGTLKKVAEEVLCHRLLPILERRAEDKEPVEMYTLFSGAAMDVVSCYIFGLKCGSNFLDDPERCKRWILDYKARQKFIFWPQEMPRLISFAKKLGVKHWFVPKWVDQANGNIEQWVLSLCDSAAMIYQERESIGDGDKAAVYNQLRNMMEKQKAPEEKTDDSVTLRERLDIASELLDHVAAGFDTTGITLTYLAWELSKTEHKHIQEGLRQELRTCLSPHQAVTGDNGDGLRISDFKTLDSLPLLSAIIMESLRLHAAIPGIQPRVTPENAELGPPDAAITGIPAGVRVTSQAYSLHLNEQVFPQADRWKPQRWLDTEGKFDASGEKARWFWAFGSGGRMCIGSNLAMLEMKSTVAAIWTGFATSVEDDSGMTHNDGYTSEPLGTSEGDFLRLRLTALV